MSFLTVRTWGEPLAWLQGSYRDDSDGNDLYMWARTLQLRAGPADFRATILCILGNCNRLNMSFAEVYRHGSPYTRRCDLFQELEWSAEAVAEGSRIDLVRYTSLVRRLAEHHGVVLEDLFDEREDSR